MASHPLQEFIRRLRRARSVAEGGHLTDAQLLERFIRQRDEAAFEVLVWRHGTLVLKVARRLLRHSADAEDVFQATFLTLARKASAIRRGTSLSSWLYKVAYRLALRVHQAADRRERHMQFGLDTVESPAEQDDGELHALLAEEVNRLPERYRAVVVLCYLQGTTTEEAARVLGCPRGTVLSRLSSARQRLRGRLARRGIAPAVAAASILFGETATATPSVALVGCVVRAALPFAAGGAAVPMVSTQAASLAQGALQMMLWNKIKIAALLMCAIAFVGSGSGWLARGRSAAEAAPPAAEPPAKKKNRLPEIAPELLQKVEKEIAKIHSQMKALAEEEEDEVARLNDSAIEERLKLEEIRDSMRRGEQELDFERQRSQERIRGAEYEANRLEKQIRELEGKGDAAVKITNQLSKRLSEWNAKSRYDQQQYLKREAEHVEHIRPLRKRIFQAEYKVRRIENKQARRREEFMARRQALFARLQQLEEKDLGLQPGDRLRDVEHKLDALRREVGELRRALERPRDDRRKKPE